MGSLFGSKPAPAVVPTIVQPVVDTAALEAAKKRKAAARTVSDTSRAATILGDVRTDDKFGG